MTDLLWLEGVDAYFGLAGPIFHVAESYSPATADEGDTIIGETLSLFAIHPNEAFLRREVARLNAILSRAKDFVSVSTRGNSAVYLYWQPGSATAPQRVLVYGGRATVSWSVGSDPHLREEGPPSLTVQLRLSRGPLWEVSDPVVQVDSSINSFGGTFAIEDIVGDQPARIQEAKFSGDVGETITNLWVGLSSYKEHINTTWRGECENGSMTTADTTVVAIGGTSNGSVVRTTFSAGTGLLERFRNDYTTSGLANLPPGNYLVLLRARLTSAGTVGIQLRWGMPTYTVEQLSRNSEILFTDTNWRIVSLGPVQIPPFDIPEPGVGAADEFVWSWWAQRLSGTPNLEWDGFVLLPLQGYSIIKGTDIGTEIGGNDHYVFVRPDERIVSLIIGSGIGATPPLASEHVGWKLRPPTTEVVIVAERATQHVLTDTVLTSFTYRGRGLNYLVDEVLSEVSE